METIEYKADEKAYYFGVYDEFSDVACTIKATKDTGVKYLDKKVSVEEIRVGDRVSLDYRGKWESADKPLTAKWIKISYHLE